MRNKLYQVRVVGKEDGKVTFELAGSQLIIEVFISPTASSEYRTAESLTLSNWATRRRKDLLDLLDRLNPRIEELSEAIEQEAVQRPEVKRLMTHPGVGALTALACVLIIGSPERFRGVKQIGSYLGLAPCEDSSADRQRLEHISKQGNALLMARS